MKTKNGNSLQVVPNGNVDQICKEFCSSLPNWVPQDDRDDINIALDELLENIKKHSHNGEKSEVCIKWNKGIDGNIQILVIDPTPNISHKSTHADEEDLKELNKNGEPHGRGLYMINTLMDEYEVKSNNISSNYTLTKKISQ